MAQKKTRNVQIRIFIGAIALCMISSQTVADNKLNLRRVTESVVTIDFSNTDVVAGSQLTINARGNILLGTFESGDRAKAAGLEVYQYLRNDSTLSIVFLAPYRSPLEPGQGTLGEVPFVFRPGSSMDSANVFVTEAKFCDESANLLDVAINQLVWSLHQLADAGSSDFALDQNYPNPFNPATTIAYTLTKPAHVKLAVFDITGREVRSLVNQYQANGKYTVQWSTAGRQDMALASGMYVARLQVDNHVATRKMIYTK